MGVRGSYTEPITDDVKEKFLDLIASGYTRPEAAAALDSSARLFRAICNPASARYDETFARQYAYLTQRGGEQESMLAERLQDEAVRRGLRSSDRLLEKLLAIYHPEWEIHRPQALRVTNVNVEELRMLIPNMPEEALREIVQAYERQKQIESGDVIEAV